MSCRSRVHQVDNKRNNSVIIIIITIIIIVMIIIKIIIIMVISSSSSTIPAIRNNKLKTEIIKSHSVLNFSTENSIKRKSNITKEKAASQKKRQLSTSLKLSISLIV